MMLQYSATGSVFPLQLNLRTRVLPGLVFARLGNTRVRKFDWTKDAQVQLDPTFTLNLTTDTWRFETRLVQYTRWLAFHTTGVLKLIESVVTN